MCECGNLETLLKIIKNFVASQKNRTFATHSKKHKSKNMKHIQLLTVMLLCLLTAVPMQAKKVKATNTQRVQYVLDNLEVKKDVKARLKPMLESFLKEKDAASAGYDKMKDKLKPQIKLGSISNEQGQQLLDAKWAAEAKELQVKKQYEQKFKTLLPVKKVYECFRLLNDKSSKILEGGDDD